MVHLASVLVFTSHIGEAELLMKMLLSREEASMERRTIEVGFGALTGSPFGLTGARVPAFSAALCSRWTLAFLEIGMLRVTEGCKVERSGMSLAVVLRSGGVKGREMDQQREIL